MSDIEQLGEDFARFFTSGTGFSDCHKQQQSPLHYHNFIPAPSNSFPLLRSSSSSSSSVSSLEGGQTEFFCNPIDGLETSYFFFPDDGLLPPTISSASANNGENRRRVVSGYKNKNKNKTLTPPLKSALAKTKKGGLPATAIKKRVRFDDTRTIIHRIPRYIPGLQELFLL